MSSVPASPSGFAGLPPRRATPTKLGLVAGGLGAYWPQFPQLLPQLQESTAYVTQRFQTMDAEVVDVGFVSDAQEAAAAAETLRVADPDLVVIFLTTYLTSSMILPIAQKVAAPILVIDLQPTEKMDHATFTTGEWLAYCGQCSVPEVGNLFRRAGVEFRSVTGHLREDRAWERIERWVLAAGVRARFRGARHGLLGHLYPGMLDVATDLTRVSTTFGSHVEVLEPDDLRVRVEQVTAEETAARKELARSIFTVDDSVDEGDFDWAAQVSVGLDRLVDDFQLDSLAYYHRGLAGEIHERLGAGFILGSSLLTARGIPAAGEYELRNSLAMLISDAIGAGGSFTEIQGINFDDGVVEMGHDGPAHLAISNERPILRGLGVFHGKRGYGVSVEFDVQPGPVTTLGLGQERDGSYVLVASEGTVVPGPLLQIGNTTSRVDFGCHPGEWVDVWSATGVDHHWALSVGHNAQTFRAAANLLGVPFREVRGTQVLEGGILL
ncbi:L-fucose/L-arabinose isomerase family protein [Frondihabitans cladoniiphilus]|uniref:L-fucose/L-arabinose isomerase family protein n=1 Tax=Frondihabitans cladoniiphilus TaxID=715785 RepID=A0ABP8VHU8_9MICO